MKKVLSILLVVMLFAAFMVTTAFAAEETAVTVTEANAKPGETVTVEISIKNNPGFVSGKVTLTYDAEALELVAMENVKFQGYAYAATGMANHASVTAVTGDGVLCTATFKVKATSGEYKIAAAVSGMRDANGTMINVAAGEGTVKVACQHSWDEGKVTKPATCTEKGEKTYTCSICGETKTEEIAKAEHEMTVVKYDETYHWFECKVCGAASAKEAHKYDSKGECACGAKDPSWNPPTGDNTSLVALTTVSLTSLLALAAVMVTKRKETV